MKLGGTWDTVPKADVLSLPPGPPRLTGSMREGTGWLGV